LIIIVVFGLIFQSFEVIEFYFQSQVLAKIVSICKVVQLALSSLIKIYFVIIEADLIWFVLLTAFDMLSLGVSYILAYKLQKLPAFFKFFRFSIAKELLQDSWPFMLSIVVFSIYQQMDIIMIKELLGIYEVGLYSAGLKIGLAHVFLSTVITMSLFPAILNSKNNCNKLYHQRIESLFSLLIFINFVVAVSIVLFGEWLIRVLLGIEYLSAYQVLIIQTWSSIFAALGFAFQQVLLAENLGKAALYRALSGLSINFILNLMLIPIYGIIGAAISLLIAQAFANYFYDVFFKKMRVYFYIKSRSFLFYRFFKATLKI
jgi:O-antigen/teichoic acid export membrane protein